MVIEAFGDGCIGGIIGVVVERAILKIDRIESLHAQRTTKDKVGDFEGLQSMVGVEELWGNRHGNGKVGSKLVVRPFTAGS